MVKTQVQFPDTLYAQLKALAAEQEWTLAETLRRGAEPLLATRPLLPPGGAKPWTLEPPANTQLRVDPFEHEDWRLLANLGTGPAELLHEPSA